jgi:hypothetical protein
VIGRRSIHCRLAAPAGSLEMKADLTVFVIAFDTLKHKRQRMSTAIFENYSF